MKTPLGTEVDLGPGHIVLDGVQAMRETGTAAPIFSARVYYGHGRPSQLLLSCCKNTLEAYYGGIEYGLSSLWQVILDNSPS